MVVSQVLYLGTEAISFFGIAGPLIKLIVKAFPCVFGISEVAKATLGMHLLDSI